MIRSRPVRVAIGLAVAVLVTFARAVVAQEPELPPDASIRLQRTACFGWCPVYSVTIDARGIVTYEGERSVRVVGRRTARIDASIVAGLLARTTKTVEDWLGGLWPGRRDPAAASD